MLTEMVKGRKLDGNSQCPDRVGLGLGYRGSMMADAGQRPPLPGLAHLSNCVSCTMCSNACGYENHYEKGSDDETGSLRRRDVVEHAGRRACCCAVDAANHAIPAGRDHDTEEGCP